jgi:nucleotide-binding universal stress UspA family protein
MYRHILIATDGSELAGKAQGQGLELARALKARVTVVTVTSPFPMPSYWAAPGEELAKAHEKATAEHAARILSAAAASAKNLGLENDILHAKHEDPAEAIVDTAARKGCDLIVMASHGYRGVKRVLLGSVAMKVLTHAKTPVLICR